jgi:hypothetical protein
MISASGLPVICRLRIGAPIPTGRFFAIGLGQMKYDRRKKTSTSKERQQHASRRTARARKDSDSLAQLADDDVRGDGHLVDKLRRKTQQDGRTSPPKY